MVNVLPAAEMPYAMITELQGSSISSSRTCEHMFSTF